MLTIECRHCGAAHRLKSRLTKSIVRCRCCGSDIRIRKRRKSQSGIRISDVIVRVVGGITFVGTLTNLIYGIATIDGSSQHGSMMPYVIHILPFFIVGLLGAYAVWHGAPRFEGMRRRSRLEGFSDCGLGLGMIVLGIGISFLVSLVASEWGMFVVASGLIGGGAGLCVKGFLVLATGRDL